MRDKIVYLVIGLLIATIFMLLVNNANNLTTDNRNDAAFDRVVIKDSLTVGEGENKITLKTDTESRVIIESKDTAIVITATPNESMIFFALDTKQKIVVGAGITAIIEENGETLSHITLHDTNGVKNIGTD